MLSEKTKETTLLSVFRMKWYKRPLVFLHFDSLLPLMISDNL